MKRALLLMMSGAVALLVGTAASAATTTGKVVVTDALTNTITIETEDGRRFLFTRSDATKIERDGTDLTLGDLSKDTKVTVTTAETPTDPLVPMPATRVHVDEMMAAPAPAAEPAADTARVESAGTNGDQPTRTAQVKSAEYEDAQAEQRAERLPTTATPLPLIALLGVGALATGLVLRLRRSR